MRCPYDNSPDVVRYGHQAGLQMWLCKKCGRKFRGGGPVLYGMRYGTHRIGEALTLYYNGMSYRNVRNTFDDLTGQAIAKKTLWKWVIRFSALVSDHIRTLRPQLGDVWIADETVIRVRGENWWFWDIIDERTRYLVASHVSRTRGTKKAKRLLMQALSVSDTMPHIIRTDKLRDYGAAILRVFNMAQRRKLIHSLSGGFGSATNINLIERFHGTIKQRTKVMRCFKRPDCASIVLDGYTIHYNFLQEHSHLDDTPPAVVAGIGDGIKNWRDLIERAAGRERRAGLAPVTGKRIRRNPPNINVSDW